MARKKKLDFTDVEDFVKCEEGKHLVELVEVTEDETQNGDDMLVAKFKVVKGDSKGAILYERWALTEKALWKLKAFLKVIGLKADKKIVVDLDALEGKRCMVEVVHEEYNGVTRGKISDYVPMKSSKVEDPDEDDDDDEDEDDTPPPKKSSKKSTPPPAKSKKKVVEDDDDDEDEDDDDEEPAPKKSSKKPESKKSTPSKSKKKPVDDDDEDDEDDWEE